MAERSLLTREQMKATYPSQWLLVKDCEVDMSTTLRKGRVVAHSRNREEIHRALRNYSGKFRIHVTGRLPPGTGILFSCPA
jgi:hypothetical protein